MAISDTFRESAVAIIKKFSMGEITISRKSGEYNVEDREVTFDDEPENVVCSNHCRDGNTERFQGSKEFNKIEEVVIVSGEEIGTYVPKNGDRIYFDGGSEAEIVAIKKDQYLACYFFGVRAR